MGDVCGHCGVGVAGGCSCGPDSPKGCHAIRPLRIGFLSIAIRKVSGGKDVSAGGACPAPTSKEPFAAIAGQSGQATCRGPDGPQGCLAIRLLRIRGSSLPLRNRGNRAMPAGRRGRRPLRWSLCPSQSARFRAARMCLWAGHAPPLRVRNHLRPSRDRADRQRAASRIARKGALQSGPYGGVCVRHQSAKFRAARMRLRAGRAPPLQMGEYLRPSRNRADRQRVAGRIARKGALQSGPYG